MGELIIDTALNQLACLNYMPGTYEQRYIIEDGAEEKNKIISHAPRCFTPVQERLYKELTHFQRFSVDSKPVNFLGILHHPQTLERIGSQIQEYVSRSSVVVLEYAPQAEDWLSDTHILPFVDYIKSEGGNMSAADLRQFIVDRPGYVFYSQLENWAAKYEKPVAVADPHTVQFGFAEKLAGRDESVKEVQFFLAMTGLGLSAAEVVDLWGSQSQSTRLSRRDFMRKLGTISAGVVGLLSIGSAIASDRAHQDTSGGAAPAEDFIFRKLRYDLTDYRNAVAVQGVSMLLQSELSENNPFIVYGGLHAEGLKQYGLHATERRVAMQKYKPYAQMTRQRLRIFRYVTDGWQQIKDDPIIP